MNLVVEPDQIAERIRGHLRQNPQLRQAEYEGSENTVYGHCYHAAEAYFHARGGTDSGLEIYCLSWSDIDGRYDGTHWYLKEGDTWVDVAIEDPEDGFSIPFSKGRRRAFITGYDPSTRAEQILEAIELDNS